jgi:glucose/arabinose dehydrogenase
MRRMRTLSFVGLRALTLALAAAGALAAGCFADDEGGETRSSGSPSTESATTTNPERPRGVRLLEVASGLDSPLHVTVAPGEPGRLYVVEQDGLIRVFEEDRLLRRPFLDVRDQVSSGGERGLLSVAFHPRYAENRLFYVNFTDVAGDTRVVEYRTRAGGPPDPTREPLYVPQPYSNHNGGQLEFGPDGLLYVGMGDGGAGGDPENRAQDLGSRLGKLLRLNVDRRGAEWEIVAYGLRNPWRFSFDRETGDLWIGDVGQGAWEEIDYLAAGSTGLVNFGWDAREGDHVFEDKEPNPAGRLVDPLVEYPHEQGCSVTGGYVYRGASVPALSGRYLYGDYCSGTVWSVALRSGKASKPRRLPFEVSALSSFGEDADGELYLVSLAGRIFRLAAR